MTRAQGRDWSAFQGPVTAKGMAGLTFGYARATSWGAKNVLGADPDFAGDWAAMKTAGLHRGAYHYLLTTVSALEQAEFFVATVKAQGLLAGDMLVCDSELPVPEADEWTLAFCEKVRDLVGPEYPVLVYTDHDTGQHLTSCTGFPLWIAWPSSTPDPAAAIVSPWKTWRFWQNGEIGGADADYYNGTAEELQTWLDTFVPAVKPPVHIKHWRTLGGWSLAKEAAEHGTTPDEMIKLASAAKHFYKKPMRDYIKAADWNKHVPAFTILYAPEKPK